MTLWLFHRLTLACAATLLLSLPPQVSKVISGVFLTHFTASKTLFGLEMALVGFLAISTSSDNVFRSHFLSFLMMAGRDGLVGVLRRSDGSF
ncbi:hypothetical protein BKA83DRAFT_4215572, partial [Pisolithus microcarpus]